MVTWRIIGKVIFLDPNKVNDGQKGKSVLPIGIDAHQIISVAQEVQTQLFL